MLTKKERKNAMITNHLVADNLNIAQLLTKKYSYSCPQKKADIYQEAVVGMCRAVENFDPTKGEYRARAYVYAERAIQKFLQKQSFFTYNNATYLKTFWKGTDIKLAYDRGDEAVEELCSKNKVSRDSMDRVMRFLTAKPISYHKASEEDSEDAKMLFSAIHSNCEEEIDKQALKKEIARALGKLKPNQANVLKELYFGDEPKTMQAVADELGVSRQRVDQIEKKALAILKKELLRSPAFCALR